MSPVQIRSPAPTPPAQAAHPVDALIACHERIRYFTALSARLGEGQASPEAARGAAHELRRYFAEALPLHEADEDLTLAPLMRKTGAPADVIQALDVVQHQHPDIDRLLARVMPYWQALEADPAQLPHLAGQLARSTERMSAILAPHLALEETTIFPAAREHLCAEQVEQLRREMRERRGE